MPPHDRLTESNLKEHTKFFMETERNGLQEQFILDYVWEQQINHEKSQKSNEDHSLSSDSKKSCKTTLSDYSRYSIEHGLPSMNGSLLISRSQLRKSNLSEIKESEPHSQDRDSSRTRKEFPVKERAERTFPSERRRGRPMKEKSLNINHVQKESDQRKQKSSKKEKKKFLKKSLRSTPKTSRRKSCKRNDSLLASSQILQNWSSDKLGTNRVTLRSDNKTGLGIFNKGKASEKTKTKGVPDLVFSEIDFLNSNPSRKRRNRIEDDFDQRNVSFSRIRRKAVHERDATRSSAQDTDETSSLCDSVRHKGHKISTKGQNKKEKSSKERGKTSSSRHHIEPTQPKRQSHAESKQTLSDSSCEDENENEKSNNQSPNNYLKSSKWSNAAAYSLIDEKTVCSPRVDKSHYEQNITSSYFASEQKNESSRYASQYDNVQPLPDRCANSHESSPTSQKRSDDVLNDKQVTSSYFANKQTLNDSGKQSSVSDCQDSQVEKSEESGQGETTNKDMELDDDSHCAERCLPVEKDKKNLQNDCVACPEENESKLSSNNSCGEKMVIYFDPSWIKQKSLLSNYSSQSQNQNNIATYKSKTYHQSRRLSRAVIAEGTKIEQLCMNNVAKDDCDSNVNSLYNGNKDRKKSLERIPDNSFDTEFENNDIVKNGEKACQETLVENTNLDHMNVENMRPCQEVINENNNTDYNAYHKDCGSNCDFQFQDLANNQFLHKSHYESNDGLMYEGVGEELFVQESAVDSQDPNLYSNILFPICEPQNFISLNEKPFPWSSDNELSNSMPQYDNNELAQVNTSSENLMAQNNKQTWGDRIDELSNFMSQYNTSSDDNSQYITAESVTAHDDSIRNYDSLDVEGDSGINVVAFVWKKHRLH